MYHISPNGLNFIVKPGIEGFESSPYLDSGGVPTIGCGTTVYPNGVHVTLHDKCITKEKALDYLQHDLIGVQEWLNNVIVAYNLTPNQNQFDAMCSFFYNIGYGSFERENANTWHALSTNDLVQFSTDMGLFNHVRGKVCNGVVNRRKAEIVLFNEVDK